MRGNPKQIWVFNTVIFSSAQADFFSLCVQYISLGKVQLFRYFILFSGSSQVERRRNHFSDLIGFPIRFGRSSRSECDEDEVPGGGGGGGGGGA